MEYGNGVFMTKKAAKRSGAKTIKKRKQTVHPKRKGGVKLGSDIVNDMWKMFQVGVSCQAISRAVSVSRPTVMRYKRIEKWVQRRDEITRRANAKADKQQVSRLAKHMENVKIATEKILAQITKIKDGDEVSKSPIADLNIMIRLDELLHGRPDSRPQLDYSKMSEEELVIEMQTVVTELSQIPECQQELQKLLNSATD